MNWNSEQKAVLTEMWGQGKSMTEISRKLHCSRNAVAGLIYRLKIQRRKPKVLQQRIKRTKPKMVKFIKPKPVADIPELTKPPVQAPRMKPVKLLDRRYNECSYLIGEHICCGSTSRTRVVNGKVISTSWCPYHYDIVYRKPLARA